MDWFCAASTCPSIIDFSWLVGALAGVVLDVFLIIAIALTPPLREHGGEQQSMGAMQKYGLYAPPLLIALLWLGGLWLVGIERLSEYARFSATAAAIVAALVILPAAYVAAHHIARRSVP
jgi:hypothetical protein